MNDINFFNQLNVLYVEDDSLSRDSLGCAMKKYFKNVYIASDGLEALEIYKDLEDSRMELDVIISDINMPNLNGLELLTKIRQDNAELPFILVTGYSNSDYLLESFTSDANEYLLKPINFSDLLGKVFKVCSQKKRIDVIKKEKRELENYLNIIGKVALISKTDMQGNITFVNELFCKTTQYSKVELLGSHYGLLRHPSIPAGSFKSMWKTIKSGKTWRGKVKNKAKDGSSYYVNETIIPIFDIQNKHIEEFVGIRFLITEEALEKREFKKKVLKNIQDNRKKQFEDAKSIKNLQRKLKHSNVDLMEHVIDIERKKSIKQNHQIIYYEGEIKKIKTKNKNLIEHANEKINIASKNIFMEKNLNKMLKIETKKLKNVIYIQDKSLYEMKNEIKEYAREKIELGKKIKALKEVIVHQDEKLGIGK